MDDKPLFQTCTSSYISWVGARTQSTLKRSPSNVKTFWLDSQRQARADFKARSGRGCLWVLAFLWFGGLTAGLVLLFAWASSVSSSRRDSSLSTCLPDDSFSLRPETYQYWSNSGFFEITLGSGRLTFTQAKAIDVIWDITVGRGGQGLLAYISWQTIARYVTTSMEVQPVTFNTYRTVFLQNESLILGIPRIVRDFCKRRGLHSRFAMVFIVLSMLFILVFPTLGSAMTGYSGNVVPRVPDNSGNYIPFNNFSIVMYTIHDGERIGLSNEYHVTVFKNPDFDNDPVLTDLSDWDYRYDMRGMYGKPEYCESFQYLNQRLQCTSENRAANVSIYVGQYGTVPQHNVSSMFANQTVDSPTLNITAYDVPNVLNKTRNTNPKYYQSLYNGHEAMFLQGDQLYSQARIERDGTCQAEKTYQWGFSFIQLTIMVLLLWLWTAGILVMYTTSKFTRLQRGRQDVAGEYKAVFELADAMQEQLVQQETEDAKAVQHITESALRKRITKRGGAIAYDSALLSVDDTVANQWAFKAWAKREVWWLLALAVSFVVEGCVINAFVSASLPVPE
ncbi:hypothetical protein E8E11_004926 [Didymella keratinophila]|nr:hypothetical protein E8E11_004926 [Didymella keratinophila]